MNADTFVIDDIIFVYNFSLDDQQRKQRKKLHQHFGLPLNRPYFRRANKFLHKDELNCKYLVNPHTGIKSQGKKC